MALSSCKTSTLAGLSAVPQELQSSRTLTRATDFLLLEITRDSTCQYFCGSAHALPPTLHCSGRDHFRDCVSYVYGCSDMTECIPEFNFAPEKTFTIAHAVRAANKNYASQIFGKVSDLSTPCPYYCTAG